MDTATLLKFKPVTLDAVKEIAPLLRCSNSRTCDYTLAGLLMWADYFKYEYAVFDETLFVMGVAENDVTRRAFSAPIGRMPMSRALRMIKEYCDERGWQLMFSAVPEDRLPDFYSLGACRIVELEGWADYLYRASDLATLSGNKYSKKRNHVNRFASEHPQYTFVPLDRSNIDAVYRFYRNQELPVDANIATAEEERRQVFRILERYDDLPFEGAVLSAPDTGIVAFAIGEVVGDTLYVHIEKMNHEVNGAGETINKLFAAEMMEKHGVIYVNREEDVNDEGLRKAKMSYHPEMLLKKYNLIF